jgi:hypothetical protein
MDNCRFDESGRFVIEDEAALRPFASFLPGIAGPMGIPMWAFYVNRRTRPIRRCPSPDSV